MRALQRVRGRMDRGDRLIVRRVRNHGDQAQLFATWRYHALVTNRVRWTAPLGLGVGDQQTVAKTLRRTLLALPGRLTRPARQWTLHLPAGRPWAHSFAMAWGGPPSRATTSSRP